ncbi:MAG: glycosyltransferase family 4 protein, partial [Kiritimatiellia bacterium]
MKKVGFVFNSERIIGGGELSFIDLVGEIRKLGVSPVVFVPGPGEVIDRIVALGVAVHKTPWPPIRLRSIVDLPLRHARLAGLFRELGLDLIHANGARCMLYAGPAARRAGIPCVWHVRVLERDMILDRIRARYARV